MKNFDEKVVLHQLESAGIKDVARIRRDGYQIRVTFDKFIKMYVTKGTNHTTKHYIWCFIINLKNEINNNNNNNKNDNNFIFKFIIKHQM